MNETVFNEMPLTGVCAALCAMMDVPAPACAEAANPLLTALARGKKAQRVFMYHPDAVAMWLYQRYPLLFAPVLAHTQLCLPLRAVMPSVTPVCFGSMYTGAQPAVHGIEGYVKPVITIDTFFDALIRAGKKPAIVSTAGDSLSMIYQERRMDYWIHDTIEQCNETALALIRRNQHDFILLYNGDYDAQMHRDGPMSAAALEKLRENGRTFGAMAEAIGRYWAGQNTLIGFATDHGCHEIDGAMGSHGLSMPQDLNIAHFYGFYPASGG